MVERILGVTLYFISLIAISGMGQESIAGLRWYNNWEAFFALVVLTVAALGIGALITYRTKIYGYSMGFAILGAAAGLMIGLSKTPVISQVISALLVFVLGIVIYIIIAQRDIAAEISSILGTVLLSFGILFIAGIYMGANLRLPREEATLKVIHSSLGNLSTDVKTLQAGILAAQQDSALLNSLADKVSEISNKIEKLGEETHVPWLSLEGAVETARVEITVKRDILTCCLRVRERVNEEVLFEGVAKKGSRITASGESLEIVWPVESGDDAISIKGWESVRVGRNGWLGDSDPEEVTNISKQESIFCIVFPELQQPAECKYEGS